VTKKEAKNCFVQEIYGDKYNLQRILDKDEFAVCEAWNDFTDALCKQGTITEKQYDTWSNPFRSNPYNIGEGKRL